MTLDLSNVLAILAICAPVVGACVAVIYRSGKQMGEFNQTLKNLAQAVDKLSSLGERVVVLETRLGQRPKE